MTGTETRNKRRTGHTKKPSEKKRRRVGERVDMVDGVEVGNCPVDHPPSLPLGNDK